MSLPSERRRITRIAQSETLYPLCFKLRFPNQEFVAEVVNYHFRGACLRLPSEAKLSLDSFRLGQMGLDFYLGKRCLKRFVPFRIAWESLAADGLVGVEFLTSVTSFITRPERYPTHPQFPPLVTTPDPLNPNRNLYFRVVNISENGMLLLSSLANKHLLPGMNFRRAILTLPGEEALKVSLKIANVHAGENCGTMRVGVSLVVKERSVIEGIRHYISVLSPSFDGRERLQKLADGGMLSKRLRTGLTFRVVDNSSDYERVLKLRFLAYAAHGKVRPGTAWEDQGEGLAKEGTLLGAFLGGQLVASMELRFGNGPLKLKTLSLIGRDAVPGVDTLNSVEVNRLAVHPLVQGSDIVLGLFQMGHAILVAQGGRDLLIMATDSLRSLYERIGFSEVGIRIPHPHLVGQDLNLMLGRKEVYLEARHINAFAWMRVYQASHRNFQEMGLVGEVRLAWWRWVEVAFYGGLFSLAQLHKRLVGRGVSLPPPERTVDADSQRSDAA